MKKPLQHIDPPSNRISILWSACLLALLSLGLLSSCSLSRALEEGEYVLKKNEVKIEKGGESTSLDKKLAAGLEAVPRPQPSVFPGNWRVRFYCLLGKPAKGKGIKYWLQNKVGKEPVRYKPSQLSANQLRLRKYLLDEGFFHPSIQLDTSFYKRKAKVIYRVNPGKRFFLREVFFPEDSTALSSMILGNIKNWQAYQAGKPYRLAELKESRTALVDLAQNEGYYGINASHFRFFVDTIAGQDKADIYLSVELPEDTTRLFPYRIGRTYVIPDYSLRTDQLDPARDTFGLSDLLFIRDSMPAVQERILADNIFLRSGDSFQRKEAQKTVNRLLGLGLYNFVNQRFIPRYEGGVQWLDREIRLTPAMPREVAAGISTDTRTGNFWGVGLNFSYSHLNLLRQAERFSLNLSGALETQLGDDSGLINSSNAGVQASLSLPYLFPFRPDKQKEGGLPFVPHTRFSAGFNYQERAEFFSMTNFNLRYGFQWKPSAPEQHELYLLSVDRVDVLEITDELRGLIGNNPSLRSGFEDVYITSFQYTYRWSSLSSSASEPRLSYSLTAEAAGNVNFALASILRSGERPYSLLGRPFSQFFKLDLDVRRYLPLRKGNIASRFFLGIGAPYGNSSVLPYIKQYYSGGSVGMRAFRIRTLGPGSYRSSASDSGENEFLDQTGDIKLEANIEYRFPIFSYVEGAVFLDAGNIWLLREGEDLRRDGVLKWDRFFREIALGPGAGLRVGFSTLVIRLDVAFPVRIPWLPQGDRWTFSTIDFSDPEWRKEFLVWNLAVGYPF
jgi:outer membrane protein insertion porin family